MAKQGKYSELTLPMDTAAGANLIVAFSGVNVGNGLVATAGLTKLIGVTRYAADTNGYSDVILQGSVAQITVGAGGVVANDDLMSDANGKAVTMTPSVAGAGTLKGRIGLAMNTAAAGALVDCLILPQDLFAA